MVKSSKRNKRGDPQKQYQKAVKAFDAQRYIEAILWLKRAAELKHPEAIYQLGCCYEKGIGVVQDEFIAINYYIRAQKLGHAEAKERVARLTGREIK